MIHGLHLTSYVVINECTRAPIHTRAHIHMSNIKFVAIITFQSKCSTRVIQLRQQPMRICLFLVRSRRLRSIFVDGLIFCEQRHYHIHDRKKNMQIWATSGEKPVPMRRSEDLHCHPGNTWLYIGKGSVAINEMVDIFFSIVTETNSNLQIRKIIDF